jgi:magnesium transporter
MANPRGKSARHLRSHSNMGCDALALGQALIGTKGSSKSKGKEESDDNEGIGAKENTIEECDEEDDNDDRATGISPIDTADKSRPEPSLVAIKETETLDPTLLKEERVHDPVEKVTYRERLGGFLHPRDMRKLVNPFSASNEPELIVRRHAMLLNFDPLRAIVLRDRLLVLVPDGADSILVELEKRVRGGSNADGDGLSKSEGYGSTASFEETSSQKGNNNIVKNVFSSIKSSVHKTVEKAKRASGSNDSDIVGILPEDVSKTLDKSTNSESDVSVQTLEENDFDMLVENEWEELEGRDWIDLPFELLCVDAVLHCVVTILADDVFDLQLGANSIINELVTSKNDFGDLAQELLRQMKNSIKEMTSRVKGFCRALDVVLEDYEDMALMNLSRLISCPERFIQPVSQAILDEESDEPELILEAHLQKGNTLTNALTLVGGQLSTTEDFAVRKSDTIRNRLLYINMMISILSLTVGLGSFVGSLFGMNVTNGYEDSPDAFVILIVCTILGAIAVITILVVVLRKLGALPNLV